MPHTLRRGRPVVDWGINRAEREGTVRSQSKARRENRGTNLTELVFEPIVYYLKREVSKLGNICKLLTPRRLKAGLRTV